MKQSQIGVYYEEQFKRAAEKVDRFRDKLDGLKSLISDDMKIDKNTGLLTESGALSITLDVDDINASTENLKTYIKERQQMPDYAGMAKAIEKNIQNIQNLSGNTYVNNFYIDGAQDTESILREIDKHLDKKIQAHDKKQVRDFKSLR